MRSMYSITELRHTPFTVAQIHGNQRVGSQKKVLTAQEAHTAKPAQCTADMHVLCRLHLSPSLCCGCELVLWHNQLADGGQHAKSRAESAMSKGRVR